MSGDILRLAENYSDHMEIMFRDDKFYIDVENEWAGDTETGFGQTSHVTLSREDAETLRDWLIIKIALMDAQVHP